MHGNVHLAIIGSGIVGEATGKGFASTGCAVTFCDVNAQRLEQLRSERFDACDTKELGGRNIDVVMLCVPTPTKNGHIVLDYLQAATKDVAVSVLRNAKKRVTVVVRSTVLPGTTESVVLPLLEEYSGKKAGADFGLCMNPEFLRAESPEKDFLHPKGVVVGSIDKHSADVLEKLYAPFGAPVHACRPDEAEMAKYVSNIFDAGKISFFNEMRVACDTAGVDAERVFPVVTKVCEACWNPAYGTKDMGPFDGMCFPKDTQAFLTWGRKHLGLPMKVLRAMIDENGDMQRYFPRRHRLAKARIAIRRLWRSIRPA